MSNDLGSLLALGERSRAERDAYNARLAAQRAQELEAARVAAEQRAQAEVDARAKAIAEAAARQAAEAAAKVLAEEALQKEKEFEERTKAEADERIKAAEEEAARNLQEKDKIIEVYMKAVEEYKNALDKTEHAVDLENLVMEYMKVAKQNQYLSDLIKTLTNPLDPILLRSTMVGDLKSAKAAMRLGANVNTQDMLLETPLHKACSSDDMQMVRFLLSNGCDLTKENIAGKKASDLTSDPEIRKLISAYQQPKPMNGTSLLARALTFFAKPSFSSKKGDEREQHQPTGRNVVN